MSAEELRANIKSIEEALKRGQPDDVRKVYEDNLARLRARLAALVPAEPIAAPVLTQASTEPVKAAPVKRNKPTSIYRPVIKGQLPYPFFPVPLVPGKVRREDREEVEQEIEKLRAAMPHPALLVYLSGCARVDRRYVFSMSAPEARRARGLQPSKSDYGDVYLRLLVEAGMIEQVTSGGLFGGRRVASTFRVLPWSPALQVRALAAFEAFRLAKKANQPEHARAHHPEHGRAHELA